MSSIAYQAQYGSTNELAALYALFDQMELRDQVLETDGQVYFWEMGLFARLDVSESTQVTVRLLIQLDYDSDIDAAVSGKGKSLMGGSIKIQFMSTLPLELNELLVLSNEADRMVRELQNAKLIERHIHACTKKSLLRAVSITASIFFMGLVAVAVGGFLIFRGRKKGRDSPSAHDKRGVLDRADLEMAAFVDDDDDNELDQQRTTGSADRSSSSGSSNTAANRAMATGSSSSATEDEVNNLLATDDGEEDSDDQEDEDHL
jgi:hypothetical protein